MSFEQIFEKPAVVIDMGGHTVKAGFTCDNHPVSMFRNFLARPKNLAGHYGKFEYEVPIGDDAVLKGENLNLSSPVVNGRIVQWDNIERVWHHILYRELKVAPEDRAVILACSSVMPMQEKPRLLADTLDWLMALDFRPPKGKRKLLRKKKDTYSSINENVR